MLRLDILTLIKAADPLGREEGPDHTVPSLPSPPFPSAGVLPAPRSSAGPPAGRWSRDASLPSPAVAHRGVRRRRVNL